MSRARAILFAAFFIAGAATTMLSPLLPLLQSRWQVDDASLGLLFTAQFAASFCTSALASRLAARFGLLSLLAPGLALVASGAAALALAPWPHALLAVVCSGAGLGLIVPAGNLGLAALSPGDAARPLALLNLCWAAAAVAAPLAVVFAPSAFLPALAALAILLAAAAGRAFGAAPAVLPPTAAPGASAWTLLVATILFLYVGIENTVSGWVATHAVRAFGAHPAWSAAPSVFWLAMLAGRALTPALLRVAVPAALLRLSIPLAALGAASLVWAPAPAWLLAGGALCGLALAPVFPLTVAAYAGRNGSSSLVFSLSGLGGALFPFLAGLVAARLHAGRSGLALVLPVFALLFPLMLLLSRALRTSIAVRSGTSAHRSRS